MKIEGFFSNHANISKKNLKPITIWIISTITNQSFCVDFLSEINFQAQVCYTPENAVDRVTTTYK